MTTKRIIKLVGARVVGLWNGTRVVIGYLAEDDNVRQWKQGQLIRSTKVVGERPETQEVETETTVYQLT